MPATFFPPRPEEQRHDRRQLKCPTCGEVAVVWRSDAKVWCVGTEGQHEPVEMITAMKG